MWRIRNWVPAFAGMTIAVAAHAQSWPAIATYEGADASLCAAALIKSSGEKGKGERVKGEDAGLTVCVFDREGSAEEDASLLEVGRLRA